MTVAPAPRVAVFQTAPRPWPSPAAFNRPPPATQTYPQVSDGSEASEAHYLPPQTTTSKSARAAVEGNY